MIGTEAWALAELPETVVVVGAGASGSEVASACARLGVEAQLFEGLDRVLPSEDADISKLAERGFKKQGITVRTKTLVENVESKDDEVTFTERTPAHWLPRKMLRQCLGPEAHVDQYVEVLWRQPVESPLTRWGLKRIVDASVPSGVLGSSSEARG